MHESVSVLWHYFRLYTFLPLLASSMRCSMWKLFHCIPSKFSDQLLYWLTVYVPFLPSSNSERFVKAFYYHLPKEIMVVLTYIVHSRGKNYSYYYTILRQNNLCVLLNLNISSNDYVLYVLFSKYSWKNKYLRYMINEWMNKLEDQLSSRPLQQKI